jgi:hypothetical protein
MKYKNIKMSCDTCRYTHYYQFITVNKIYCYKCGEKTDYTIGRWCWA